MSNERKRRSFKLHLLALILALALAWYSINPAPRTAPPRKLNRDEEEAKKREAEPEIIRAPLPLQLYRPRWRQEPLALPPADDEEDDFEWPEFIDG